MRLIKMSWTMFKIMLTMQTNSLISMLRRVPGLSWLLTEKLYRRKGLKSLFALGGLVKGFLGKAVGGSLWCLLLLSWLPAWLSVSPQPQELFFVYLLAECIAPAVMSCGIFRARESDYVFLNHFMLNPTEYYHFKIGREVVSDAIVKLPVLLYLFRDGWLVLLATGANVFFTLAGCCWYLFVYDKKHGMIKKSLRNGLGYAIMLAAYVGLKSGVFERVSLDGFAGAALYGFLFIGMGFGTVLCYRRLLHYQDYKRIAVQFANKEAITLTITVSNAATEGEGALNVSDWKENREYFMANQTLSRSDYLNRTFFKRFRKIFSDQRRQIFLLAIPLGVLCGYLIRIGVLDITENTILSYTPMLIPFVSGCMLFGERFTELCFRFVDMPMLYHGIYGKEDLKQSIQYRYRFLIKHSLVALSGLTVFMLLVLFISGIRVKGVDFVFVLIAMELFMLVNEIYKLLIYYWIQPYTADMSVRSPVFKVLGVMEGLLDIGALLFRGNIAVACIPLFGMFCLVNVLMAVVPKNRMFTKD